MDDSATGNRVIAAAQQLIFSEMGGYSMLRVLFVVFKAAQLHGAFFRTLAPATGDLTAPESRLHPGTRRVGGGRTQHQFGRGLFIISPVVAVASAMPQSPPVPWSPTCHGPPPATAPHLPRPPTFLGPSPATAPHLPRPLTCLVPHLPPSPICHRPSPGTDPHLAPSTTWRRPSPEVTYHLVPPISCVRRLPAAVTARHASPPIWTSPPLVRGAIAPAHHEDRPRGCFYVAVVGCVPLFEDAPSLPGHGPCGGHPHAPVVDCPRQ